MITQQLIEKLIENGFQERFPLIWRYASSQGVLTIDLRSHWPQWYGDKHCFDWYESLKSEIRWLVLCEKLRQADPDEIVPGPEAIWIE